MARRWLRLTGLVSRLAKRRGALLGQGFAEIEQDARDGIPVGIELHLRGEGDGVVVAIHQHGGDVAFRSSS